MEDRSVTRIYVGRLNNSIGPGEIGDNFSTSITLLPKKRILNTQNSTVQCGISRGGGRGRTGRVGPSVDAITTFLISSALPPPSLSFSSVRSVRSVVAASAMQQLITLFPSFQLFVAPTSGYRFPSTSSAAFSFGDNLILPYHIKQKREVLLSARGK